MRCLVFLSALALVAVAGCDTTDSDANPASGVWTGSVALDFVSVDTQPSTVFIDTFDVAQSYTLTLEPSQSETVAVGEIMISELGTVIRTVVDRPTGDVVQRVEVDLDRSVTYTANAIVTGSTLRLTVIDRGAATLDPPFEEATLLLQGDELRGALNTGPIAFGDLTLVSVVLERQ